MTKNTEVKIKFFAAYIGFVVVLLLCAMGESIINYLLTKLF